VLSAEVRWNAPRRGSSRAVVNLPTQANLEGVYANLGFDYAPGVAHAYVAAVDCEGPAGGIQIATSTTVGELVYSGQVDNRCVPDTAQQTTHAICGSAYWYEVPPGEYRFGYTTMGATLQSRPLPVKLGIVNHLQIDPD
jgi:hypothetical protein